MTLQIDTTGNPAADFTEYGPLFLVDIKDKDNRREDDCWLSSQLDGAEAIEMEEIFIAKAIEHCQHFEAIACYDEVSETYWRVWLTDEG